MNKAFLQVFLMVSSLTCLAGCFSSDESTAKMPSLLVVNVLDKEFFDDCHIPGSIHISMMDVLKVAEKDKWPKETKIVVHCSNYSCTASTTVCRQLTKMGFLHVWDYEAGTAGWYQDKLPVKGPAKSSYLTQANKPLEGLAPEGVKGISTEDLHKMMQEEK